MKQLSFLLIVLSFFVSISFGQVVYSVYTKSENNSISYLLQNNSSEEINNIEIKVVESPKWIVFDNSEVRIKKVGAKNNIETNLKFTVSANAPIAQKEKITIQILKSNGDNSVKEYLVEALTPYIFDLQQNYPNPFNPATTIKYQIPQNGNVVLKVFDVLGKEITTLVNETKDAGNYEVKFDARMFPSGIYFYRLTNGNNSSVKKMVLMK